MLEEAMKIYHKIDEAIEEKLGHDYYKLDMFSTAASIREYHRAEDIRSIDVDTRDNTVMDCY